ncbi:hypothetical protein ABTL48_20620, partial [Acinetobacter baumannii]
VIGQRLRQNLAAVAAHRRQAATAAMEIGRRSQAIAEGVGRTVVALQIGDITRQRLEHIDHAVAVLVRGLEPPVDAAAAISAAAGQDGDGDG